TMKLDISTGIESISLLGNKLEQNYPNPFNSVTTINWQLAKNSKVTLKVLDIVGRTVATLVDEQRAQGKYETQFNAATLPKGIYFCQLKAGEFSQTRKMILRD
ncbi:MAG TPA: T9SS type A sorting domain-containing protein, partial [Draconibacterium sp.]|nr:T9SS type A sorting domain-containing protein [Draconibacterium sp.]